MNIQKKFRLDSLRHKVKKIKKYLQIWMNYHYAAS